MAKTSSLINQLKTLYPQFLFEESDAFSWSPSKNTIFYSNNAPDNALLIHELSHALLGHTSYDQDIELIPMERDAWTKATEIGHNLGVEIPESLVENNLDTYRNWMHARSTCPECSSVGLQTKKHTYKCPGCLTTWRVNDARICGLKRYKNI